MLTKRLLTFVIVIIFTILAQVYINPAQSKKYSKNLEISIVIEPTVSVPKITKKEQNSVIKVIKNRVLAFGVPKLIVIPQGKNRILVKLPGTVDYQIGEKLLAETALLEFKKQKPGTETQLQAYLNYRDELKTEKKQLYNSNPFDLPLIKVNIATVDSNERNIYNLFDNIKPPLTGAYIKDIQPVANMGEYWDAGMFFNTKGAELFTDTIRHLAQTGRHIGVFIDGKLFSHLAIGQQFALYDYAGGPAVIPGRSTEQEIIILSAQIRGGALPIPVKVQSSFYI